MLKRFWGQSSKAVGPAGSPPKVVKSGPASDVAQNREDVTLNLDDILGDLAETERNVFNSSYKNYCESARVLTNAIDLVQKARVDSQGGWYNANNVDAAEKGFQRALNSYKDARETVLKASEPMVEQLQTGQKGVDRVYVQVAQQLKNSDPLLANAEKLNSEGKAPVHQAPQTPAAGNS